MATVRWTGGAPNVAQVDTATVGGTIEVGDVFRVTVGPKTLDISASSTTASEVASQIATAITNLDSGSWPEFKEFTAQANGADITFTALVPGVPHTIAVSTVESGGGSADSQTFSITNTIASSGRNDVLCPENYSTGALPDAGDELVIDDGGPDLMWNLDALDSLGLTMIIRGATSIGLLDRNPKGYPEYRPTFLECDGLTAHIESSARMVKLNHGTSQSAITVKASGQPAEQHRAGAISLQGSHSSNSLTVLRGFVAASAIAGETSQYSTVYIGYVDNEAGDAQVYLGDDATIATITKNGGSLTMDCGATTITNRAGQLTCRQGGVTTLTTTGTGSTIWTSTSTLATASVLQQGSLDFGRDPRAKTVTNPIDVYDSGVVRDPNNVVGSLRIDLNQGASLQNISIGPNVRLTVGSPS